MQFWVDYFHQKVPRSSNRVPGYFQYAFFWSEALLSLYYLVCFFLFPVLIHRWLVVPALLFVCTCGSMFAIQRLSFRFNTVLYNLLILIWIVWTIHAFGWGTGSQQFLILLIIFLFFNVYEKPFTKLFFFVCLVIARIVLFYISQNQTPIFPLDTQGNLIFQSVSTVCFLLNLACICIIFSSSVQATERQLRIQNQSLYKEAETDPLTGLPNRRAMIETIDRFRRDNPNEAFSIAIADLDFFKKVNDTYGHNCGDYTLVKLTELFVLHANNNYSVCRWGGEEFCFFIPGKNLDEAGSIMNDLCYSVERMPLCFEGKDFKITITIGVEENDFTSPMDILLNSADKKLYLGKERGRNQVVI